MKTNVSDAVCASLPAHIRQWRCLNEYLLLNFMRERRSSMAKQIGQLLMESGMINIDDLNEALEIQKSSSQKLGEILISMGTITPEELEMILEFQNEE